MKKIQAYLIAGATAVLLGCGAVAVRAEITPADQEALRTQYGGKVLIFRKSYRMIDRLEVNADGTIKGNHEPGYWSVDGAVQVKDVEVKKESVTFKCLKLWAHLKDDGQLHYFPVAAALKGKGDYPENAAITFRTNGPSESLDQLKRRVNAVFLGEQESQLNAAPAPVVAYIQKIAVAPDVDREAGKGLDFAPPEAVKSAELALTREALLAGQSGHQISVVLVDIEGNASVVGFRKPLHFGLEESTMETLKAWKFKPATREGKAVACRIVLDLLYKLPGQR
jgi:hypothetical protein